MRVIIVAIAMLLLAAGTANAHGYKPKHKKPAPTVVKPKPAPVVPKAPQQVNLVGYCFQTSSHGWTYLPLASGSVVPGNYWYEAYVAKATVLLDGKNVTFTGWEPWRADGGMMPAPIDPIKGAHCDGLPN